LALHLDKENRNLSYEMIEKIDTEHDRKMYDQRLAIVEPVFGNIREQKGMHRFTLRGKAKVNAQWLLCCMVPNVEKSLHFGPTWGSSTA